jgi:phage tail sheath protein FI
VPDDSIVSFTRYLPNFHTDWQNVVVRDNEDTTDTAANGIIDADRYNNNLFSLEKIKVPYISASNLPDMNNLDDWVYVRAGGITTDTVNFTKALTVSDLQDPTVRQAAKFSFFVEGGYDGVRIFDRNTQYMNNIAVVQELQNGNRLLSNGPTVKAFERALSVMNDTSEIDVQILTVPGIRHKYLTDQALAVAENRFDAIYLMDIEEKDTQNATIVGGQDQIVSVRNTVNTFRDRGLNSSFGAAYFPNVIIRDSLSNVIREVAPSVAVLGAFSRNDAVAFPWFAPAGFSRGALETTQEASVKLSRNNMDDLYQVNINPLVAFPGSEGTVVWGQKTLFASPSALERVNVRRLMLSLRRQIRKIANRFLFEPNRESTLARFQQLCQPVLKRIQDQQGVEAYLVKIDTTTTTTVDIENKTIRGKIYVVPVRTLEFLDLSFVLTNRGNFDISG